MFQLISGVEAYGIIFRLKVPRNLNWLVGVISANAVPKVLRIAVAWYKNNIIAEFLNSLSFAKCWVIVEHSPINP